MINITRNINKKNYPMPPDFWKKTCFCGSDRAKSRWICPSNDDVSPSNFFNLIYLLIII